MKGNPFIGNKFLYAGMDHIKTLLSDEYWKLPPISVEIDPTNLCNHNCVWCMFDEFKYRVQDSILSGEMERIIQECADIDVKAITFTGGGEPLMNDDAFPEAFYQVVDAGMELGLVTNGELLNKYMDSVEVTCKFVRVSLDAATSETHRKLHRSHAFNTIIDNISTIVARKTCDVGLAFLVHPDNYTELPEFLIMAKMLGVDYAQVRPVWMPGLTLSDRIIDYCTNVIREYQNGISTETFKIFGRMDRFEEVKVRDRGFTSCLSTPLVGVIGADLNVYLCCQFRGYSTHSFGNLGTQSLEDIWYGEKRRKIVSEIDLNRCPPCRYRTYNITLNELKDAEHVNFL